MSAPQDAHTTMARRILKYIKGTTDYCIFFPCNGEKESVFYADANWARDLDKCKSTMGLIFKQYDCPIIWMSQL